MKNYSITVIDQLTRGLEFFENGKGYHKTAHVIRNKGGRWIADGRYDVTNAINQPDGAYVVSVIVGER